MADMVRCCGTGGIPHFGACCYRKIIDVEVVAATLLHLSTLLLFIFLHQHTASLHIQLNTHKKSSRHYQN